MSVCKTVLTDAAINARCLRYQRFAQRRCLSQAASPPASGAAKLSNRRLLSLHGPDSAKFLQGILTNSVSADSSQAGFFAAFLNAQGKVLNDVFVYPTAETEWQQEQFGDNDTGYLVEVDAGAAQQLFKHVKRHKLKSKFNLRLLEEGEMNVWSIWKGERWTQHTTSKSSSLSLTDCRAPGMGQRVLLRPIENASETAEVEEVSLDIYTLRRYMRGIPEGQQEIPREESLPMNYNLDIMGGIDFKKGCYIGQELTIRTHHTGVVRRRVLPVQLYDQQSEPPSELTYDQAVITSGPDHGDIKRDDARKRATGKLIGSVGNIGIAMCRLEQMSDLNVTSEPSSHSATDRFVVDAQDGSTLGVRAFVPDWIRNRIRDPKVQRRVE